MKRLFVITLVFAALAAGSIAAYGQTANGCTASKRNGIYFTDCYTDTGDDTTRLQAAIDAAASSGGPNSGKLIFNENNYSITDHLILPSFITIVGTGASSSSYTSSKITLNNGAGAYRADGLFKIGSCKRGVVIRDLTLVNNVTGDGLTTAGILAQGQNSDCGGNGSSHNFEFNNLSIVGFKYGMWVNPLNADYGWQFDNVKMTHCSFETNAVGIEINSNNSGWNMSSSGFIVAAGGYGIKINHGGYISMNLLVGNGTKDGEGDPTSETFLYIQEHGLMFVNNIATEGFIHGIDIDGVDKSFPVHLTANVTDVRIKNATVVSTGNFWGNANFDANPQIIGYSDVISIGDRFCIAYYPYNTHCTASGWSLIADSGNKPTLQVFANREDSATKPMVKVLYPDAGKVLLQLGNYYDDTYQYTYNILRDSNGWLSFEGSQANPYRGFKFNGPLALPVYTYANLPTGATIADGTIAYCSNCTAGTSPCSTSGGGGGALALMAGSNWRCK
jgi:hypothetical protein